MMYSADGLALRQYGCTWLGPDYDPRTHKGATPYCGRKDLVDGTLYCQEHYARMYVKGSALRKRKRDVRRAEAFWDLESAFNEAVKELEEEGFDFDAPPELGVESMLRV
jgi:hypothetical protein